MAQRRDRAVCLPRRPATPVLDKKITEGSKLGLCIIRNYLTQSISPAPSPTPPSSFPRRPCARCCPYAGHRQEIPAAWRKDINEFAKCPNVYVKLGGIGMTSFGIDFHER
jgi:hypothetical protein